MPAMRVSEETLAQVVAEVSASHGNPRFVEETVGAFMRRQPIIGNYIAAHHQELGVEGVVLVLLHAAVIARAVERGAGRKLGALAATHLDAAARDEAGVPGFARAQPAIHDYLGANVAEDATLKDPTRCGHALDILRVVASALTQSV
jgi:hypothetical protein